ncbi:MAG: transcriptional repressor [Planctomycetota bacterium]
MRRHSRYRKLIQDALHVADGPLSATDVHAQLAETGIGIATVYRLLNEGVEDGDLIGVDLPSGPRRFEPANLPHHHHFECAACNKVFAVPGCPGNLDRLVPDGFQLERHELILSGRCSDCLPPAQHAGSP